MAKLGIAFGSGGAKGIAHLGVWQALNENGIKADVVTGCSAGSVVAACYAMQKTPQWVFDQAKKLKQSDFADLSFNPFKNRAVFKAEKMRAVFEKYFKGVVIEKLKTPFAAVAADLISGKLYEFTQGDVFTAVLASCSIPIAFPPVEHEKMLLTDGGILVRTPVKTAKKLGADKIIAIDVNAAIASDYAVKGVLSIALRCVDVMDHRTARSGTDAAADVVIRPKLADADQYKVERLGEIFERGYTSAIKAMDKIKRLLD